MHRNIKIKYNESCSDGINFWKVFVDEHELLFSEVEINVFSKTLKESDDKFYIHCTGWIQIEDGKLIINPFPTDKDAVLVILPKD